MIAALALLQWTPYIAQRAFLWGLGDFLRNYPEGFPAREPEPPLWAQRAKRAHLNMVESLPSFTAVVLASHVAGTPDVVTATPAFLFLVARVAYAVAYTAGVPFLRTPTYLLGWGATLYIAAQALGGGA